MGCDRLNVIIIINNIHHPLHYTTLHELEYNKEEEEEEEKI